MAISNLKLASAILGIGGVATGTSVGVYSYLNKSKEQKETNPQQVVPENKVITPKETKGKAISDWLAEDDSILLNQKGDEEDWKQNWVKFVEANTGDQLSEPWNFEDYRTKKADRNTVPEEFKKNCEKNSQLLIEKKGEGEYAKVKNYCSKTKPKDAT